MVKIEVSMFDVTVAIFKMTRVFPFVYICTETFDEMKPFKRNMLVLLTASRPII